MQQNDQYYVTSMMKEMPNTLQFANNLYTEEA